VATKDEIIEAISNMNVLELSELVKELEKKFGITAAAPVAATQVAEAPAPPKEEEKTEFDVILQDVGPKKIHVVKEIRALTSLGLKEAKELVDNAPKPIKTGISKEEAEGIKKKLEEAGAKVELK
jgi:large subunit ribosomal protein L7/L12